MQRHVDDTASKMRILAARLRNHATQTCVEHFRHKFETAASELEEAAIDAESRIRFRRNVKLVS